MLAPRKTESAGGVVLNEAGEVLVVSQHGTSWSLPKGHIDQGEDVLTAARREIKEESGISDLLLVKSLGIYRRFRISGNGGNDETELKTIHMFLFKTVAKELLPEDPENPEARFVRPDDVNKLLAHEKDREFFERVRFEL